MVWEVLTASHRHLSAGEIADQVRARDAGVNVSSVYRTLALFADLDLVRESRLGDDASTWEIAHADDVIHLVCSGCGNVRHHDADAVDALRRQLAKVGFRPAVIDVRVTGRCADCGATPGEPLSSKTAE